jgi:hypothetical protein
VTDEQGERASRATGASVGLEAFGAVGLVSTATATAALVIATIALVAAEGPAVVIARGWVAALAAFGAAFLLTTRASGRLLRHRLGHQRDAAAAASLYAIILLPTFVAVVVFARAAS